MKSLVFGPVNDLIDGLAVVDAMAPEKFNLMLCYLKTFLLKVTRKNIKTIQKMQLYAINIWSCYLRVMFRVINDEARTNMIETWHKQLESAVRKHQSTFLNK